MVKGTSSIKTIGAIVGAAGFIISLYDVKVGTVLIALGTILIAVG